MHCGDAMHYETEGVNCTLRSLSNVYAQLRIDRPDSVSSTARTNKQFTSAGKDLVPEQTHEVEEE